MRRGRDWWRCQASPRCWRWRVKGRRGQGVRLPRRCSRNHLLLRAMRLRLRRRRRTPAARRAAALCFWRVRTAAGRLGAAVRRGRTKRATTTRRPTICDWRRDGRPTWAALGSRPWRGRRARASCWVRACCAARGPRPSTWIWGPDVCSGGVSAGPRGVAGCSSRWPFHEQRVGGRREMRWGGDDGLQEHLYARSVFKVPPRLGTAPAQHHLLPPWAPFLASRAPEAAGEHFSST